MNDVQASIGQVEYWDRSAGSKLFVHPLDTGRFMRAVNPHATILDYGCGGGRLCHEIARLGYSNVLGVDYSSEMIRLAKAQYPTLRFEAVNGYSLPHADGSVDAIVLFAVLTCIPWDRAQLDLMAELSRVLRTGGLLLISDYPLQQDERNVFRYERFAAEFGNYGTFRLLDGAVVRHHSRERFAELLADYVVTEEVELDCNTMHGNPARIVQLWARKNALAR
jgi:SAM-dependent methyltransferase